MLKDHAKFALFLVSYIPLFVIMMIRYYDNLYILGIFGVLVVGSAIYGILLFKIYKRKSRRFRTIARTQNFNKVGLEYFVTYIIPFLDVDLLMPNEGIAVGLLLGIMAVIYVRSDLIYMNPILNLLGYNIFKAISQEEEVWVITKKRRQEVERIERLIDIGDNVLIE